MEQSEDGHLLAQRLGGEISAAGSMWLVSATHSARATLGVIRLPKVARALARRPAPRTAKGILDHSPGRRRGVVEASRPGNQPFGPTSTE